MPIKWTKYDRDDKATAPPAGQYVWVMERFYGGGTPDIGQHVGYGWELANGSDDCSVTHWAPIEYPAAPAGWDHEGED